MKEQQSSKKLHSVRANDFRWIPIKAVLNLLLFLLHIIRLFFLPCVLKAIYLVLVVDIWYRFFLFCQTTLFVGRQAHQVHLHKSCN